MLWTDKNGSTFLCTTSEANVDIWMNSTYWRNKLSEKSRIGRRSYQALEAEELKTNLPTE